MLPRPVRRLVLLLAGTALATGSVVALPSTARADVITPGQAVVDAVITTTPTDFFYQLPPGARPTLTVTSFSGTGSINVTQRGITAFTTVDQDPTSWFAEFSKNTGDTAQADFLELSLSPGPDPVPPVTITFTIDFGTDIQVPVTSGTPTGVSFAKPGDRALLTFDANAGDRVSVSVADVALDLPADRAQTSPALRVVPLDQFGRDGNQLNDPFTPGAFFPYTADTDGRQTLAVDPTFDRVGTATVTVTVTPGVSGSLSYGQGTLVSLSRPGSARLYAFLTQDTAPTLIRLFGPELTRSDGTPGSADVDVTVNGTSVATGTIRGDQSVVTVPAGTLPSFAEAIVTVTAGPDTTGTVSISPQFDSGPATPLVIGANPVSIAPTARASGYSFDAAANERFEVYVQNLVFDETQFAGSVEVYLVDPFGFRSSIGTLDPNFAPSVQPAFTTSAAGTWRIELGRQDFGPQQGYGLDATLLLLKPTVTRLSRTLPVDETVTVTRAAQSVEVTVPGRAGDRLVARLLSPAFTAPAGEPDPVTTFVLVDGAATDTGNPFSAGTGELFLETLPLDADGDVRFTVDPERLATGSARLVVRVPQDSTGTLNAVGTPTVLPVTEPGARARYTFTGTAGQVQALDIPAVNLPGTDPGTVGTATVTVTTPDGGFLAQTFVQSGSPSWLDLPGVLPQTGTYTVTVDPFGATTGSVTVTRVTPRVITTSIGSGQQRTLTFARGDVNRLTFTGRAGQRPVFRFTNQTLSTGFELRNAAGQVIDQNFGQSALGFQELTKLPANGTYTLVLDPFGPESGKVTVRLDLVTDPVTTIAPGATVRASWQFAQNPEYRFPVKEGQRVAVDLRSFALSPASGSATVALRDPNGFNVAFASLSGASAPRWLEAFSPASAAGTWSVVIDGVEGVTGSATFVVRAATDQVFADRIGKNTGITITQPVQNAALTFSDPGDFTFRTLSYTVTGSTIPKARLVLVGPFGEQDSRDVPLGRSSGSMTVFGFFPATWRLVLDPVEGATGKATVRFTVT